MYTQLSIGLISEKEYRRFFTKLLPTDSTVILYGSKMRGDAHPDSDIDVLIIEPDDFDTFASGKIQIPETPRPKRRWRNDCVSYL
ncbi:MAG: nucleotidyltransferase domain-containing protein [Paramuribaculum sp.]|nr:nucleotidyltransferase domain-containing protein [Paramuribaculum sp.]